MKLFMTFGGVLLGLGAACGTSAGRPCAVAADCASAVCRADGTCAPVAGDAGGPGSDGGVTDGGEAGADDAAEGAPPSEGGTGCTPNHDGTVTRAEIPLGPGLHAKFRVATNVGIDTAGVLQGDGTRVWDLRAALAGDHDLGIDTVAVAGQWFAADYTGASYSTRLSDTSDLLGVFETTPTAILLRGEVSPTNSSSATKIVYSAGVAALQLPMQVGTAWKASVTATGQLNGISMGLGYYTEDYDSKVDARGMMKTPYGDFDVLRVSTTLKRTVGVLVTTVHSFSWVAECAGPIASAHAKDNDTTAEPSQVAEVQRLTP